MSEMARYDKIPRLLRNSNVQTAGIAGLHYYYCVPRLRDPFLYSHVV